MWLFSFFGVGWGVVGERQCDFYKSMHKVPKPPLRQQHQKRRCASNPSTALVLGQTIRIVVHALMSECAQTQATRKNILRGNIQQTPEHTCCLELGIGNLWEQMYCGNCSLSQQMNETKRDNRKNDYTNCATPVYVVPIRLRFK